MGFNSGFKGLRKTSVGLRKTSVRVQDTYYLNTHILQNPTQTHTLQNPHIQLQNNIKPPQYKSKQHSARYTQVKYSQYNQIKIRIRYSDSLRAGLSGDRIRVEAIFSAPVQNSPDAYTASYTMSTVLFPGVERRGCGVDYPFPFSTEFKERVELCLYSTSGPSWPVLG